MTTLVADVLGREVERAAVRELLDRRGLPAAVLLEGEAGIGKTTVLREGLEAASDAGFRVLACAPAHAEQRLSFAGLADLLDDAFDQALPLLPVPQAGALEVALLRAAPDTARPDRRAVATGLLSVLRALSDESPLVVAVDDVQWLDPPSAATLEFALRRLRREPVAVLVAGRTEQPGEAAPLGLERAFPGGRLRRLALGPLSMGALHALLAARLGATFARPTLRRIHEASGGNPLFALELARELGGRDAPRSAGEPLPVPERLNDLILSRLTRLPRATRDALVELAAASSLPVDELDESALAPALEAEVVTIRSGRVVFVHPLLASAAYSLPGESELRDLHRRLAARATDVEARARHLALASAQPDEAVAAQVLAAADRAFARGAPGAAAELAAQARRLTPPEREDDARRRGLAEAEYHFEAGDTERAAALLEELLTTAEPGPIRARLLSRQARLRHFGEDVGGGVALLRQALAEAGDDPALRAEIEEGLAWGLLLMRSALPAAAAHARSATRFARRLGDPAALAEALAAQALTEFVLGGDSAATMERALALEEATLDLRVLRHPSFAYGYVLSCNDELERARDVFRELERRAHEHGDDSALAPILNHLALVETLAGDWPRAEALAVDAYAVAVQSGQRPTQASSLAKHALLAARRGQVDEARDFARRSLEIAGGRERALARGGETALWSLGFLELSLGRPAEAHAQLGPLVQPLLGAGVRAAGELRALPDDVEALVALGRVDEADALLADFVAVRPSAVGAAERCHGLVLAARGQTDASLAALDRAVEAYATTPLPFERARALLTLGEVQRRAKRRGAARETLGRALSGFEALGAQVWAQRTRDELGRIGGRAREGGLTPTERRVAELVAEGFSNKEAASALFVTVKTVEGHLSRIYEKLGVRSRAELASRVGKT